MGSEASVHREHENTETTLPSPQPVSPPAQPESSSDNEQENEGTRLLKSIDELLQFQDDTINSLARQTKPTSILSRLAIFWNEMWLWKRIVLGFILIAPTLAAGIAFQVAPLLIFSILTLATYIACSFLFDQYAPSITVPRDELLVAFHQLTGNKLRSIFEEVFKKIEQLATEITVLTKSNQEFKLKNARFAKENTRLGERRDELDATVDKNKANIEVLEKTCAEHARNIAHSEQNIQQCEEEIKKMTSLKEASCEQEDKVDKRIDALGKKRKDQYAQAEKQIQLYRTLITERLSKYFSKEDILKRTANIDLTNGAMIGEIAKHIQGINAEIAEYQQQMQDALNKLDDIQRKLEALQQQEAEDLAQQRLRCGLSPASSSGLSAYGMFEPLKDSTTKTTEVDAELVAVETATMS